MTVVATVAGMRRANTSPTKPAAQAAVPLTEEQVHALLKLPDAFDRLAYVFEPKRMRHRTLWDDAFTTMLLLSDSPKRIDNRWLDRAISLLEVRSVRNGAIFVVGASKQPRALDALVASAEQEVDGRAATELAERGDPRAGKFLKALLVTKDYRREAGWILDGLGRCGDQTAVPVIEQWIWSPDEATLTVAQVAEAHQLGLTVLPWTVNTPEAIARMIEWHVDGIISDFPDRFPRR